MIRVVIDGAKGTVELRGGVLFLRWIRGASIEEQDARSAMATVRRLRRGRRYPMLVDMATATLSGKARTVFAASCPVTRLALLGSTPVDWVVVKFFLGRCSPRCPARFFTSFNDAVTWLRCPSLPQAEPKAGGASDESMNGMNDVTG
jgi:hypothetical protein